MGNVHWMLHFVLISLYIKDRVLVACGGSGPAATVSYKWAADVSLLQEDAAYSDTRPQHFVLLYSSHRSAVL